MSVFWGDQQMNRWHRPLCHSLVLHLFMVAADIKFETTRNL